MTEWQRHLYLNPEWRKCKADTITVMACAASIAVKLRALAPFDDHNLDDDRDGIATEFETIAEVAADDDAGHRWFDDVMSSLYDWGDTSMDDRFGGAKACWVDTMSPAKEEAA